MPTKISFPKGNSKSREILTAGNSKIRIDGILPTGINSGFICLTQLNKNGKVITDQISSNTPIILANDTERIVLEAKSLIQPCEFNVFLTESA